MAERWVLMKEDPTAFVKAKKMAAAMVLHLDSSMVTRWVDSTASVMAYVRRKEQRFQISLDLC